MLKYDYFPQHDLFPAHFLLNGNDLDLSDVQIYLPDSHNTLSFFFIISPDKHSL